MDNGFPTDDTTLCLLIGACKINPDTGQTHLMDFLSMGERVKSKTLIEDGAIPVYEVEFEEGYAPFSEQQVIQELAEELMHVRSLAASYRQGLERIAEHPCDNNDTGDEPMCGDLDVDPCPSCIARSLLNPSSTGEGDA